MVSHQQFLCSQTLRQPVCVGGGRGCSLGRSGGDALLYVEGSGVGGDGGKLSTWD
jgi:hypothetical protein